jgi:branched-chain amino acid transport system ATP-binding protein
VLKIKEIHLQYGNTPALKGVSLAVEEKEIVTLLGANGAGKSSLLRAISGLVVPRSGEIEFLGGQINGFSTHKIVAMGISHVPEGRHLYPQMSVQENLEMGAYNCRDRQELQKRFEEVFLHFSRLKERAKQLAGTLSGGEQQMAAMGRGLMAKPKLFLLDEPSLGLAPMVVKEIGKIILDINKGGTTILLVEQNARMALQLAHRGYVLETGRVALTGPCRELLGNEHVIKAYLGG